MDEDEVSPELAKAVDGAIVAHRADQAYDMLMSGMSHSEVAAALDYNSSTELGRAVRERMGQEARNITSLERESILAMEMARLDRLQRAHWESALYGDIKSTEIVLKIMALRIKITGIDQPDAQQGQHTVLIVSGDEQSYIEKLKGLADG